MNKNIKEILKKGRDKTASNTDKKEMHDLFHQAEYEYELKGLLLKELTETEVPNASSPDFKEIFKESYSHIFYTPENGILHAEWKGFLKPAVMWHLCFLTL